MAGSKKYEIDMCNGVILPKMLLFAIPLACSSIMQLLFNAADIIIVGRFAGDNSLAAVGANTALIGLLTNLFIGLAVGANVIAARFYGAKDQENLSETVQTSIVMAAVSGVILTLIGVVGARWFLALMQTPPEVLDLATLYLVIYSFGMTAMMVFNFGSAILRAAGDTRRPLYYLTAAGIVNVILNIFFVVYLHIGVAGVAIATVISQFLSGGLVLRCLIKDGGSVSFDPHNLRVNKRKLAQIVHVGLPAGMQGVLFSLSNVVIQSSINSFGAVAVAGNAAAASVEQFIYFSMNAFYQAVISFTSQNYGAGKKDRLLKILVRGLACVVVTGGVMGQTAFFFGRRLLSIYTMSPAVIDAGIYRMSVISTTYFLCGMMDVMSGAIRGIGYSIIPTVVTLIGACGMRFVWIATVFQVPAFHTTRTVYMAYPVTWVLTIAAHAVCYYFMYKKVMNPEKDKLSVIHTGRN